MVAPESAPGPTSLRARLAATAMVVLLFAIPAVALILNHAHSGPIFADQEEYHLPTIRQFAAQWPAFDFRAYPAAMTPGYHLLMAAIAHAGGSVLAMQFAGWLVTIGLLATLAWTISGRLRPADVVLLCLPLSWSQYVLQSGVYLSPQNLAWWGVLAILLLSLRRNVGVSTYLLGGLLLWLLVMVRQVHLWTLAPMLVAAWMGSSETTAEPLPARVRRAIVMLLCALPAIATLGWFYRLWGGLVPPTEPWLKPVGGINLSAFAISMGAFGLFGPFFAGWVPKHHLPRALGWGLVGAIIAGVVSAIPPSTYDMSAGRWSGLWNAVGRFPILHERSVLIIGFACVGGFVIAAMLAGLERRNRVIVSVAVAGFVAALATINQAWLRYNEPMVLMVLPLSAGIGHDPARRWPRRALLALLAVMQGVLTLKSVMG